MPEVEIRRKYSLPLPPRLRVASAFERRSRVPGRRPAGRRTSDGLTHASTRCAPSSDVRASSTDDADDIDALPALMPGGRTSRVQLQEAPGAGHATPVWRGSDELDADARRRKHELGGTAGAAPELATAVHGVLAPEL
eukprot:scaffold2651_cov118-Isochrysis_galbana.AAC.7